MTPRRPKDYLKKHEPFRFRLGDAEYALPTDLSVEAMATLAAVDSAENAAKPRVMQDALREFVPGDVMDAIAQMPGMDFPELMADWMTALSGGDSGNSDGSSTS